MSVDLAMAAWRKSSYSGGSGSNGDCVEVAYSGSVAAVRDSKAPTSGALEFPAAAWSVFISRNLTA